MRNLIGFLEVVSFMHPAGTRTSELITVNILGTRGVPAGHSGFEYFAHHFSRWLAAKGHRVTVYCQGERAQPGAPPRKWEDDWEGVRRVHIETRSDGTLATLEFDLRAAADVIRRPGTDLVLGYNTAVFNLLQAALGRQVFINMDGIEWIRRKWSLPAKAWFFVNELVGANAFRPIADHPEIANHLRSRSIRELLTIPYGSEAISEAPLDPIRQLGLEAKRYFLSIARLVPENSIHDLIAAHGADTFEEPLVVLGRLETGNAYHKSLVDLAGRNVIFTGPIFDATVTRSLRFHALAYLHGHTVGGTNPSLIEALGTGSAIIAHSNRFNRWTAGEGQMYFSTVKECTEAMRVVRESDTVRHKMQMAARTRHLEQFTLEAIHERYVRALSRVPLP